jgi:hypothetical protein
MSPTRWVRLAQGVLAVLLAAGGAVVARLPYWAAIALIGVVANAAVIRVLRKETLSR